MGKRSNKIDRKMLKLGDHIYSWRKAYVYAHHGIYVGEGKVIHFTPGAGREIGSGTVLDPIIFSSIPSRSSDDGVIISCIDYFLSGGDLYLFKYGVELAFFLAKVRGGTCTLATSDPPEDVIHRANYLLQNGFGVYDLLKKNCEHFATYCKTGLVIPGISAGGSGQTATLEAVIHALPSLLPSLTTTSSEQTVDQSGQAAASSGKAIPILITVGKCIGKYAVNRLDSDIGRRRDVVKVPVERLVAHPSLDDASVANDISKKE